MKKLNNKGMTLIELIISLSLVTIVVLMVMQLLLEIRNEDSLTKDKAANFVTQGLVTKAIQDDLLKGVVDSNKVLSSLISCGTNNSCINFNYKDGTVKKLQITNKSVNYDNEIFRANPKDRGYFGGLTIEKINYKDDSNYLLKAVIPMIDGNGNNYPIEIIYLYDTTNPLTLTGLTVVDTVIEPK